MAIALEYASPGMPRVRRWVGVGVVAASVAVASAGIIVWASVSAAHDLVTWSAWRAGAEQMAEAQLFAAPFALVMPGGAWALTGVARVGQAVCRWAFWSGLAGWMAAGWVAVLAG